MSETDSNINQFIFELTTIIRMSILAKSHGYKQMYVRPRRIELDLACNENFSEDELAMNLLEQGGLYDKIEFN